MRDQGFLDTGDGGRIRYARWRTGTTPRGTVVLLNGRCEFIERYDEIARDWVARGFQAFSLDWRGQGLSSRFLPEHEKGHVPDYRVLDADLTRFLDRVVAPAAPGLLLLFAHSMGGLIGLRHLLSRPDRFAAAILSAPMFDVRTDPFPRWVASLIAHGAAVLGCGSAYAFGQGDYDPRVAEDFDANPMTGDRQRYSAFLEAYRKNPELRVGGVTFGWLAATFRALDLQLDRRRLVRLETPILVLSAPNDRLVPADSHHRFCRQLPRAVLHSYPEVRHEPLMESDAIRARVWADIDNFLAEVLRYRDQGA